MPDLSRDDPTPKILDGIRVIDLSRVLAGPYCGQLLADFGATVIKIESPEGDENRRWPPLSPEGVSANFASVNRGKRAMVLNLKTQAARDILHRLALQADVLLHSFLPDTAARLGISNETLHAANPRLIIGTISGYGALGPLAEKRGYDLMVQAFGGIMSTTGEPGGPPLRCGASVIDMTTGLSLYAAVVTALLRRATTGQAMARQATMWTSLLRVRTCWHAAGPSWMRMGRRLFPRWCGTSWPTTTARRAAG